MNISLDLLTGNTLEQDCKGCELIRSTTNSPQGPRSIIRYLETLLICVELG